MKQILKKASILITIFLLIAVAMSFAQRPNPNADRQLIGAKIKMDKYGRSPVAIWLATDRQIPVASFFEEYRKSFPLSRDNDLIKFRPVSDKIGQTHYRFKQSYKGVEIEGVQFILHEKEGGVSYANGRLIHDVDLDVTPALSEAEALKGALSYINAEAYMWENESQEAFLKKMEQDENATFYPKGELRLTSGKRELIRENLRLVYRFDVYAEKPLGRYYVYVDANTGEVINSIDRIQHSDVAGTGLTLYNGSQNITIDSFVGGYRLQEVVRGDGIQTYDLQHGTDYGSAVDFVDNNTDFTDPNAQAGVSAHWATEYTYDYYLNKHGRNSFDDAGGTLYSYVHYSTNYNNAFWNGLFMTYGDGDGVTFTPLVSIDVVAHELTHGVTQYSADLIYSYESGALNESFSDIFGTAVEFYIEGPGGDWIMGEDITPSGAGIRSLENPNTHGDPDTYLGDYWYTGSGDYGGVHTNCGVQSFWFYLLSEGGSGTNDNGDPYSVTGIGIDAAAQIAYRNLTVYLVPSSQYYDAREGAINAAIDLFGDGSAQHQAVMDAWYAVGVYELPPAEGILVWEGILGGQDYSGAYINNYLTGAGHTNVTYTNIFPPSLIGYDAVFLSFGNYNNNYTPFNDGMASAVQIYLAAGGKVYLEGGDALGFNQGSNTVLHGLFGLSGVSDGSTNIIDGLQGQPGAITEGMLFTSSTQVGNGFIDTFTPGTGILALVESGYGNVAVQYATSGGDTTFCFSYALAELVDGPSTKTELMAAIVGFFFGGAPPLEPPIISVTPDAFDEALPVDGTVTRKMTISNLASPGALNLNFTIIDFETTSPLTTANIQVREYSQKKDVSNAIKFGKSDLGRVAGPSDGTWFQMQETATANLSDLMKRSPVHDPNDLGDILESFPSPGISPMGMAYDPDLNAVWVTNEATPANIYLLEINPPHTIIQTINLDGLGLANSVNGIAVVGDLLYLTDFNGDLVYFDDHIYTVNKHTGALGDVWHVDGILNPNTIDNIDQILGIAWTGVGMTFYVTNNIEAIIRKIELTPGGGNWVTLSTVPSPSGAPLAGIDNDPASSFWVTDALYTGTSFKLDNALNVLGSFGNPGTASAGISSLQNSTLWMSDFATELIYVIDAPQDALWLTEVPPNGSVEPGASLPIDVNFNATGLEVGDYYANIRINSNDPLNPVVTVPVHLNVYEENPPDIDVSTTSFTFTVPVNGSDNDVMAISNTAPPDAQNLIWYITEQETTPPGLINNKGTTVGKTSWRRTTSQADRLSVAESSAASSVRSSFDNDKRQKENYSSCDNGECNIGSGLDQPQAATLEPFFIVSLNGGYETKGVGMRGVGAGDIMLSEIPDGATIEAAFLYWDYVTNDPPEPGTDQGVFNSTPITGLLIGSDVSPCWPQTSNFSYRADITGLVTGNGTYSLTGFVDSGDFGTSPSIEGAGLVVIYSRPDLPVQTIVIYDGNTTIIGDNVTETLSGFTASDPVLNASITYLVADGQASYDEATFNGTSIATYPFDGSDGEMWDTDRFDVTSLVPSGATSVTVSINTTSSDVMDCLVWLASVFSVSGTSIDCPWLSEVPPNGIVAPGESDDVAVIVNATGLALGNYTCDMLINSNDPDELPVVPVELNVVEAEALVWNPLDGGISVQEIVDRAQKEKGLTITPDEAQAKLESALASANAIVEALNALSISNAKVTDITTLNLADFKYVFIVLGQFPANYEILDLSPEAGAIDAYIAANGKVYMEGGDVWYYDPLYGGHNFGPTFGINGVADGAAGGELNTIIGYNIAEGQDFAYGGGDNFPDHIEAAAGFLVHSNDAPPFDCGVANDPLGPGGFNKPRTIGTSFEFGQLVNGTSPATRNELMANYIDFLNDGFGTLPADALIWIPDDVLTPDLPRKAQQRGMMLEEVQAIAHTVTSHLELQAALEAHGKVVELTNNLTTVTLSDYAYVFVVLGIFPNNHVIGATDPEASQLENYLAGGGKLYMEGGDVWYFDPTILGGHDFGASFSINATHDGADDLKMVLGSAFALGMDFVYVGQNNFIDHVSPVGSTDGSDFTIHFNHTPSYGCGIGFDNTTTGYRTIGNSFEFGGLKDNSIPGSTTKLELMGKYLEFFDAGIAVPVGQVNAQVSGLTSMFTDCPVTFSVTIDLTETNPAELLGAYNAKLTWDPTLLQYVGYTPGDAPFNNPIVNEDDSPAGVLRFSQFVPSGAGGKVNVIDVGFQVIGDPGLSGVLDVNFSDIIAALTFHHLLPIAVIEDATFVTVEGCLSGDVTGDGDATIFDALIIATYDVGSPIPVEYLDRINQGCGDVTEDGETTIFDALVIATFDVGLEVPFPVEQQYCPEE